MLNSSFYSETATIGSILINNKALLPARQHCKAEDFQNVAFGALFHAACSLADQGKTVDAVTVLREANRLGADLNEQLLLQTMDATPSSANIADYAAAVHEQAVRRKISNLGEDLQERANDETKDVSDLLSHALDSVSGISGGVSGRAVSSYDSAVSFLDYREQLESGELNATVSTGYHKLDDLLGGGMLRGGLYILAARPGVGKTTLGLQIADRVARNAGVCFVSLEMSDKQLTARRIAVRAKLPIGLVLQEKEPNESQQEAIAMAAADISQTQLSLAIKPGCTVSDVSLEARSTKNLKLVVIDYLGLLTGTERGQSCYERTTANSNALKKLAISLDVPILCLCQLNRSCESREDKRPHMADLRDSGAIEQDADAVLLLNRLEAERTPQTPAEPDTLEVIVEKNRHGATGNIRLNFYPKTGLIIE